MENIGRPNYTQSLRLGDLELIFRPMSYRQINENSMIQFEEQKTLQMLADGEGDEKERMAKMGEMLKKITEVTSRALAENIAVVVTPTAQVDQQEHISEWLMNCDRQMFAKIRDHIIGIKEQAELKPLAIKCSNCSHDYQQPFTLDMSNFFAAAS